MTLWSDETHTRIAAAIKKARGKRSAQWLADRTAELGYPMTRSQIANYESGRKQSLDVAELIVLAAALDTSPVVLVYPGPYVDDLVEALPGVNAPKFIAAQWFSAAQWFGMAQKPGDDPVGRWQTATRELDLSRRLADLEQQRTQVQLDALGAESTPESLKLHHGRLKLLDDSIADIRLRLGIAPNA